MSPLVLIGLALIASGGVLLVVVLGMRRRSRTAAPVPPRTVADLVRIRAESDGAQAPAPAAPSAEVPVAAPALVPAGSAAADPVQAAPAGAPTPRPRPVADLPAWPAPEPARSPDPEPSAVAKEPATPDLGTVVVPDVGDPEVREPAAVEPAEPAPPLDLDGDDDPPWRRAARVAAGLADGQAWPEPAPVESVPLRLVRSGDTARPSEVAVPSPPATPAEPEAPAEAVAPAVPAEAGAPGAVVMPSDVASRAETAAAEADGSAATGPEEAQQPAEVVDTGGSAGATEAPAPEAVLGAAEGASPGDGGPTGTAAPGESALVESGALADPVTPVEADRPAQSPAPAGPAAPMEAAAPTAPIEVAAAAEPAGPVPTADPGERVAPAAADVPVPVDGSTEPPAGPAGPVPLAAVPATGSGGWDDEAGEVLPAEAVPERFAEDGSAEPELSVGPLLPLGGAEPPSRRDRLTPEERAAEQEAADLALLRTFGFADPGHRPDTAPVVAMTGPGARQPVVAAGDAQPVRFRAVRRDGVAVGSASITLLDDRGGDVADTIADADGRGELLAPAAGTYVLVSTAAGYLPGAVAITVAAAPVEADVLLARSASVAGTVSGEDGPIVGARVTLVQDGEIIDAVDTGDDGAYRIGDIGAGEYGLSVAAAGCEPTATLIDVSEEADVHHDVELTPASPVADDAMSGQR